MYFRKKIYSMTETDSNSLTFNYSDVFFCYHSADGKTVDKTIDFHLFVYIYSGELVLTEDNKTTIITKGQCVFIRRSHRVSLVKQPTATGEDFRGIFINFRRSFLKTYFAENENKIKAYENKHIDKLPNISLIPDKPQIISLFLSMVPYFDSRTEPSLEIFELKMQEALVVLLQLDERFYPCLFDFSQPWKIDIEEFINENYMCDLTLDEIARFTGRSLATFKRDFKQISELSPQRWIIKKRLEVAYNLLFEQNRKVSDIYLEVGFKNLSHFSTAFKQKYGFAPTQFSNRAFE